MRIFYLRAASLSVVLLLVILTSGFRTMRAAETPNRDVLTDRIEVARFYEDALIRFQAGEYREAIIQLKNALQQDTKHLPSRILLGRAYLATGYPRQAEAEFLLAKGMGADTKLIDLPLAESYFKLGKFDELLSTIDSDNNVATKAAEIEVFRGKAHLALGKTDLAAEAFENASELDPTAEHPRLGRVIVHLRRNEAQQALALLDEVVAANPENAEAWLLKGKVAQAEGRREQALENFSRSLDVQPDLYDALLSRATLFIELGRLEEAQQDLDKLYAHDHVGAQVDYLQAIVFARTSDDDAAKQSLLAASDKLAALSPELFAIKPRTLLLASTVYYLLGRKEEAERHVTQYLEMNPGNVHARRILAHILLDRNEPEKALSVIQPAYETRPEDPRIQVLKGRAHLGLKEYAEATRLFEQAAASRPDDDGLQRILAQSLVATGQIESAIDALSRALKTDTSGVDSAIALAALHLKHNEANQAVDAAKIALAREPRNLVALNVFGIAQMTLGNFDGARAAFDRAIEIEADFLPAKLNLAKVDVEEGHQEKARRRYLSLLERDSTNLETLDAIARLEERAGDLRQAIRWREKLRNYHRNMKDSDLRLIELYLRAGDPSGALTVAWNMKAQSPDDSRVEMALGVSEMAAGNIDKAKFIFSNLVRDLSYDAAKLYPIARYQIQLGDLNNAYWTLSKTVDARPDWLEAQVDLARVEMSMGKTADALKRALALQTAHRDRAVGHILEGDIHRQVSHYPQAEQAYRRAMAVSPSSHLAIQLYTVQQLAGLADAAIRELEIWVDNHPQDKRTRQVLASALAVTERYDEAGTHYERLLALNPDNPAVLNDLAVIYQIAGDPRAVELAQKAYRLSPDEALIADTLGWVLVSAGKHREGLRYLREAQSREAMHPEINFHIAVALHELGRDSEARQELERVFASGQNFSQRQEAEKLLQQLSVTQNNTIN